MQHRGKLLLAGLTVMAALAALLVGAVGKSSATVPANFVSPVHVGSTFEGCRNDGTITFPSGGPFVCADAAYTSGNLGKGWNELDLVPFHLKLSVGSQADATTDFNLIVGGDSKLTGVTGWDVIGAPSVHSGSDASCSVSANAQDVGPGITGGADSSLYRVLSVHLDKGKSCTIDYYMRIALGAAGYPGSSLQAYMFTTSDFNGSKSTIPLPVNQILAQSLTKDMSATSSQTQAWNISKSPSPASIHYGDICSANYSNAQPLAVTVTWEKAGITPSGQIELITHVYATNPSARTITVTPTDKMYEGSTQTTQVGTTDVGSAVDVPANTTQLVLTDDQTVSSTATSFNDVATATYIDKDTGVPVPGSTQATASADVSSTTLGQSATAADSESITGSGLTFAVATPSFGAFTGGYTAGTYTVGPVGWSSGTNTITSNGSVVFNKTIKLDPAQVTSGSITDTATITPSDGGSPVSSAPLTVNIDSTATSTLTINKNLSQAVSSAQTFYFDLKQGTTTIQSAIPVTVAANHTSGSATVSGLTPGSYTVHEETPSNAWSPGPDQTADLTGCSGSVTFTNTLAPAVAFANKVTDPTGFEQGWTFTLTRPDSSTLTGTTNASGNVVWTGGSTTQAPLSLEGTYTISETQRTGWNETGAAQATGSTGTVTGGTGAGASCSFTVAYPTDADLSYGCTITNQSRAHVMVTKTFEGHALTGTEAFVFQLRSGADTTHAGATLESQTLAVGNDPATFAADLIPGQTYQMCEVLQTNINSSLSGVLGHFNPNGNTGVVCINFTPTPGETVSIFVGNTPVPATAQVKKVSVPASSEAGWVMTLNGPGAGPNGESVTTTGTGFLAFATVLQDGGSYTITETPKTGWDQTGTSTECSFTVHYPADAGRTFSCTITNTARGSITIKKVTNPAGGTGFTFTGDVAGTLDDQGTGTTSDLVPGTYTSTEAALAGWTLQSISCDDGSSATHSSGSVATATATFKLDPGEHVTCTFTNQSRGHVRVIKTLNGAPLTSTSQQFTFELRLGDQSSASTAALQTLTTDGINLGTLSFTYSLVPGTTYAMCELLVAGFGPNVSGGYGPYNPSDNSNYLCWNFQITVAQVAAGDPALTFNVDNSHATAKGLTIGYWKNHAASDCKKSKGKQTDVLGQYLDGITLGIITFRDPAVAGYATECNAVQTLSKNTFSGVGKSSDPLFNMAAQLLAADLNVITGDTPSSTVATTISAAQALLVKYGWNGQTYNGPLLASDAALANSYNTILDKFNNNQI